MNADELEFLALDAHARGTSWHQFWRTYAADVQALDLPDRGPLQRVLCALVCEGDTCGLIAIEDGYSRPMDHELDEIGRAAEPTHPRTCSFPPTHLSGGPA